MEGMTEWKARSSSAGVSSIADVEPQYCIQIVHVHPVTEQSNPPQARRKAGEKQASMRPGVARAIQRSTSTSTTLRSPLLRYRGRLIPTRRRLSSTPRYLTIKPIGTSPNLGADAAPQGIVTPPVDLLQEYRALVDSGKLKWDDEQVRCVMKVSISLPLPLVHNPTSAHSTPTKASKVVKYIIRISTPLRPTRTISSNCTSSSERSD
jgi:hypothetical protein